MARKRRLELCTNPCAQFGTAFSADLLQEGCQQEAANAPGHAHAGWQGCWAHVETAIDVDLLVGRRTVAAVFLGVEVRCRFHRHQDLPGQRAAANRIKAESRTRLCQCGDQVVHKAERCGVDDTFRANVPQDFFLSIRTHHVHEINSVRNADLVQHLAKVRSRRRVQQRRVTFHTHDFSHRQRCQRIDEAGCAIAGRRTVRQFHALGDIQHAILRVHFAAETCDRLAQKGLRRRRRTRGHYRARAFIAHCHRLVEARRHGTQAGSGHFCGDDWTVRSPRCFRAAHIGCAEQQAKIGWVDRCRFNANDHIVRAGRWNVHLNEGQFQLAAGLYV